MTDATTRDGDYIPAAQPGEPTAYNGKAYTPANQMTPGRTGYGDNNNIRVFRYADVLLMNAEAKVRKGQNGDAPLNLVRERAGLAPIKNATLDQILEERQVELALEWGERFFDLVRTDKATQELPGFVKGESEYYPIPQDLCSLARRCQPVWHRLFYLKSYLYLYKYQHHETHRITNYSLIIRQLASGGETLRLCFLRE